MIETDRHLPEHDDRDAGAAPLTPPEPRRRQGLFFFALLVLVLGVIAYSLLRPIGLGRDGGAEPGQPQAGAAEEGRYGTAQTTGQRENGQSPDPKASSQAKGPSAAHEELPAKSAPVAPTSIHEVRQEGIEAAARLVKAFPESWEAFSVLGLAHNRFGNTAEAEKAWQKSLELNPEFTDAYCALGRIAAKRGQHDRAVELLEKALATDAAGPETYSLLAEALSGAGRTEDVVVLLEDFHNTAPGTTQTHFWLGQAHLQKSQFRKAKECHEAAIARDPNCTYSYYGLARACGRLGEKEKAREYLEKFQQLKARDRDAESERLDAFDDLAAVSESVAYILSAAAKVYDGQDDWQPSEALWLRAAALDRANAFCRLQLASLYQRQNRVPETRQMMIELGRIDPENVAYHLNAGILSARLGEFDAAEAAFRRAREVAPQNAAGYLAEAQLCLQTNRRLSQAAELARTAVGLEPTAPNYFLLASACSRSGDLAGAKAAIERAMELDPDNPEYENTYASIRKRMSP